MVARGDLHSSPTFEWKKNDPDSINGEKERKKERKKEDETKERKDNLVSSEYAAYAAVWTLTSNVFFSVSRVNWHWWSYFFPKRKNIKDEVLFLPPPFSLSFGKSFTSVYTSSLKRLNNNCNSFACWGFLRACDTISLPSKDLKCFRQKIYCGAAIKDNHETSLIS